MMEIIQVFDKDGKSVGFTQVKDTDMCKACGEKAEKHLWIQADNGNHINCSGAVR